MPIPRMLPFTSLLVCILLSVPSLLRAQSPEDEQPLEKMCWVLEAIDTPADHGQGDAMEGWRAGHRVQGNVETGYTSTRTGAGMRGVGSVWHAFPREGRATYTQPKDQGEGSGSVSWTVPPAVLCYGDEIDWSISASAQGEAIIGGFYGSWANQFDFKPIDPKIKDPMQGVKANKGTNSGSNKVRFTPGNRQPFPVWIQLTDEAYDFQVHYHYRPLKKGEKPPPKQDPPGSCTKTFGKTWPATTWGTIAITLDGDKASGTYTKRPGSDSAGTLMGTVSGNTLDGTWMDSTGGAKGTLKWTISEDGCSITGTSTVEGSGMPPGKLDGSAHPPKDGGTAGGTGSTGGTATGGSGTSTGGTSTGGSGTTAIDLTGYWMSDTGVIHFIRQVGDKVYWSMENLPKARNILIGTISGGSIAATWIDLPGGADMNTGTMSIKIDSNDHLTKTSASPEYGASTWTRVGPPSGAGGGAGGGGGGTPVGGSTGGSMPPMAHTGNMPWETAKGHACIDRWIAETTQKLNAYDGGDKFNKLKPWGIDPKYGVITNKRVKPSGPPADFAEYNYDRYWYIWAHYVTEADGSWSRAEWNGAHIPALHAYVEKCIKE